MVRELKQLQKPKDHLSWWVSMLVAMKQSLLPYLLPSRVESMVGKSSKLTQRYHLRKRTDVSLIMSALKMVKKVERPQPRLNQAAAQWLPSNLMGFVCRLQRKDKVIKMLAKSDAYHLKNVTSIIPRRNSNSILIARAMQLKGQLK